MGNNPDSDTDPNILLFQMDCSVDDAVDILWGDDGIYNFGVSELGYDNFIVRAPKNNTSKNAQLMQCPECQSTHVNKNGQKKGKQNYICVGCGRQFIDCYKPHKGYSEEVKRESLKMYVNGMGFRAIERIKGVHHTSIINWV